MSNESLSLLRIIKELTSLDISVVEVKEWAH